MSSCTPSRTASAPGLIALLAPLLVLGLLPPAHAATVAEEGPAPATEVETSTEVVPVEGVDEAALSELRGELAGTGVETLAPAAAPSALEADPAAEEVPDLLTEQLDVDRFTLAAVVWTPTGDDTSTVVDVRLREQDGWSEWQRLEVEAGQVDGDPTDGSVVGTEPLLTDGADGVQVRLAGGTAPADARVVLVDGGRTPADDLAAAASTTGDGLLGAASAGSASPPPVVTRAQWGADDRKLNGTASVGSTVRAVVVHHTASTNSYTSADARAQVRSVYAYHTDALGWTDVGYNFLVDKFGTVYEGRKGSITAAVVGAHTGGFNADTMGVSALGNYETAAAPSAMVGAVGRVAGWKLSQYGVDPSSSVTLTSAGGGTSRYAKGSRVTMPAVFAHRQVGLTACPGANLYAQMGTVREVAAASRVATTPPPAPVPAPVPTEPSFPMTGSGAVPLAADVDGDGKQELGWFRGGWFAFEHGTTTRYAAFGRGSDVPVTGDWDDDGVDGIGVFRDGRWYLRDDLSTGPHDLSFGFGRAGDVPVVGRWAGQSTDGIGVVRGQTWFTRRTVSGGASQHHFRLGRETDVPVLGTWLGDGVARPGVVRGTTWHLATSIKNPVAVHTFGYGRADDVPLVADVDGDGTQTATVARSPFFYFRATHNRTATVTHREFTG